MRRYLPALTFVLPLLAASLPVDAATTYYHIVGSTAASENGCPAWVPETNQDDCSYNASNPSGLGTDQWIGPVFSAGYYAPGAAPPVFTNTLPPPPIITPGPELPLGGKTGIPIAAGFIAINDNGTLDDPLDDVIFGTIEFGAFERNVATSAGGRVVESFGRVIHRIVPPASGSNVSDGPLNAGGGRDYIVGLSGGLHVFPSSLSGATDDFPSEIASQSSNDPGDVRYWTASVVNGIAHFEGTTAIAGITTSASVWDYICDAGAGPGNCDIFARNEINWDAGTRARFDNLLLRISTDSSGHITAGTAFLVNESNLSATIAGNDSWQATTLSFTGTSDSHPAAFDDRAFLTEGVASVTFRVLDNDEPGAAPVTVTIPVQPTHGSATVTTNPVGIRYTKNAADSFLGDVPITYTITDNNGDTDNAQLVVTITDPVTCTDDSPPSIAQNAVTRIDELVNDTGLDVPPVTVSLTTQPTFGTATVNLDNTITYTPPADTGGLFTFRYRVNEGATTSVANPSCTVSVRVAGTVVAVNDSPPDIEDHVTTTIDVLANDPASANAPVTINITSQPGHGALYILPGTSGNLPLVRYSSILGYEGPDSFRYTVTDADGDTSNEATVSITVIDTQPVVVNSNVNVEDEAQTAITPLGGNTTLVDAPVTLTITAAPTHGTAVVVPATGNNPPFINYTPDAGYLGADSLSYRVTDSNGDFGEATIAITVADALLVANDDPTLPIPPNTARNGDVRAAVRMFVLTNDTGLADRPITIEITQQPTLGTASLVAASTTGNGLPDIAYASNPGSAGTDIVKYRLRDADGDVSADATVTIAVANGTPAVDDDPRTPLTLEDNTALFINVLANDTGRNNRPLTITITQQPAHGTVVVNPGSATSDPTVTYTPTSGFAGADSFRYRFTDADQQASVSDALVPLTIVDSAPALVDLERTGDARELTVFDVYTDATGLVDTPLTLEIIQQPTNGTANVVTGGARPQLEYASNNDFAGTDTVRYRVTDSDGDFSEATLTLNVANPTPVATDDEGGDSGLFSTGNNVVIERLRTQVAVLHNDQGVTNRPVAIQITDGPDHGTAEIDLPDVTGFDQPVVAYEGASGYSGPDSFKYTVTDDDGDISNEATVSFLVVCFPVATADGQPTPIRTSLNAAKIVPVLDNDGGLCVSPVVVSIESAVNGTAVVNADNTITFTPTAAFTGQWPVGCDPTSCPPFGGGFTYRITDGNNETNVASATIDVLPPPVTDSGGSSAMDPELLALLLLGGAMRGRLQSRMPNEGRRA